MNTSDLSIVNGTNHKISTDLSVPPLGRLVSIRNARDAKRLYSKLLKYYQTGSVETGFAKTMAYLLQGYLQACHMNDIETRIKNLENRNER